MQQQNIFPLHQRPDIPLKVHSVWSLMFITSRERLHYSHHYTYSGFKINFFFNQQLHFVTQINTKNSPHWSTNTKRKPLSMSRYSTTNLFGFDSQRSIQTLFTPFITQLSKLIKKISQPFKQNVRKISMLDQISWGLYQNTIFIKSH